MAWYTNEGFDKLASSKMIKCPKCGTMNSASAHKCKNCGHVFHSEKKASEQNLDKKVLKAFKDEGGALGMKALKKHVPEKGAVSTLKALMKRGLIVEHPHGDYYTPQVKKAAQTATKTNPELWERSKAEAKAKMGGKHSARAMQLATQIYKKKGGGYSGSKPTAKNNSLKKWGKQKWQWSKEKKAAEGKGVYLPAAKIQRLKSSPEGRKKLRAAERKKSRATKQGEQYSSHGLAAGTSLKKEARADYLGEAALLKLLGKDRGLKPAKRYAQIGDQIEEFLLMEIPGTHGKYMIKNPRHRRAIANAISHPEALALETMPFNAVGVPIINELKKEMTGIVDVEGARRQTNKLDINKALNTMAAATGLALGISKADQDLKKSASVEYRGRTFPGYNKPVPSDKKNKKKMVLVKRGDRIKLVHFGQKGYEDFTQHKDKKRRKNYLTRSAGIKNKDGKLTKNDPFSPNYWARRELW